MLPVHDFPSCSTQTKTTFTLEQCNLTYQMKKDALYQFGMVLIQKVLHETLLMSICEQKLHKACIDFVYVL